jgi:hypothetical protein
MEREWKQADGSSAQLNIEAMEGAMMGKTSTVMTSASARQGTERTISEQCKSEACNNSTQAAEADLRKYDSK